MIKPTSDLVHEILKAEPECRNSDNILYLRILQIIGKQHGVDVNAMSVPELFRNMKNYAFPAFETVRRTRQKVQECNPELRATDTVEAYRTMLEEEYKDYARRHVV